MRILITIMVALLLTACADSSQKGKEVVVEVTFKITQSGDGKITINPGLDLDSLSGDTKQDTSAIAEATPNFDLTVPIAQQGGTANAKGTAEEIKSLQDNRQEDIGNPVTDNSVQETITPISPEVTVLDLNASEEYDLKWSEDRGRWVTWLKNPASFYGVPIEFVTSGSCAETYIISEINPTVLGFTVVDDFHYGAENPSAAEVLAPLACTGATKLKVTYKAL